MPYKDPKVRSRRARERRRADPKKHREGCYEWRRANPDRWKAIQQKHSRNRTQPGYSELTDEGKKKACARSRHFRLKYYERYLVTRLRRRARGLSLPFDLVEEDIVLPEACPVLGIPIEKEGKGQRDNAPSVDRFIPKLGYVRGNIRVISMKANRIKNDATVEELEAVLRYMKGQQDGGCE